MTRTRRAAALCLGVLCIAGCRTTVQVDIETDDTSGGTITVTALIDADALEVLGGREVLELGDLDGTGWDVDTDAMDDDGGYRLVATRPFSGADDLQAGLDELAGPGVFAGVVSVVDHRFAQTDSELSVEVSVSGDPAQFSDDALTETLGGLPLGYSPEEFAFIGAGEPGSAIMTVRVTAPGGEPDEVSVDLTSGEPQTARATSVGSDRDVSALMFGVGGVVLVLMGAVLLVVALVRRRRL